MECKGRKAVQLLIKRSGLSSEYVSLLSRLILSLSRIHTLSELLCKIGYVSTKKTTASRGLTMILLFSEPLARLHQKLRLPEKRSVNSRKLLHSNEAEVRTSANLNTQHSHTLKDRRLSFCNALQKYPLPTSSSHNLSPAL